MNLTGVKGSMDKHPSALLAERTGLDEQTCRRIVGGSLRLTSKSPDCKIAAEIKALGDEVGARMSPSGKLCTCPDCSAVVDGRTGPFMTKGTRVHATWFNPQLNPPASLSGMQFKLSGTMISIVGKCAHFRGDHPTDPKNIRIYLDIEGALPDSLKKVIPHGCTHEEGHVEIREEWVRGIETEDGQKFGSLKDKANAVGG